MNQGTTGQPDRAGRSTRSHATWTRPVAARLALLLACALPWACREKPPPEPPPAEPPAPAPVVKELRPLEDPTLLASLARLEIFKKEQEAEEEARKTDLKRQEEKEGDEARPKPIVLEVDPPPPAAALDPAFTALLGDAHADGPTVLDLYQAARRSGSLERYSSHERARVAEKVAALVMDWARTGPLTPAHAGAALALKDAASEDVELREPSATALGRAATFKLADGDTETATRWAKWASELSENGVAAYLVKGQLAYQANQLEEALKIWEEGLRRNPGNASLISAIEKHQKEKGLLGSHATRGSAHFTLSSEGRDDFDLGERTLESLELAHREVGALLGAWPGEKVAVVLYGDRVYETSVRDAPWSAGQFDGKIRLPAGGALGQTLRFRETLYHEYAHALIRRLTGGKVPSWLNEGLAQLAERPVAGLASPPCGGAHQVPLHELVRPFGTLSTARARMAYAEAFHAAERLVEEFGITRVQALLKEMNGRPFPEAFERALGVSEAKWTAAFDAEGGGH